MTLPAEERVLEREFSDTLTNFGYDRDTLQVIVDRALETEALAVHDSVVMDRHSSLRPGDAIYIGGDRARVVSIEDIRQLKNPPQRVSDKNRDALNFD